MGLWMTFVSVRVVEWGDCDAAGIVFYPNYFRWMDAAFHAMCRDLGFHQNDLPGGLFATPLVDAGATFHAPAYPGEELRIEVGVVRLGVTSLSLTYGFNRDDALLVRGREDRVCVIREGDAIAKTCMPDTMRSLMERYHAR